MGGVEPYAKIVPFRSEYYELKPERRHLISHLVHPVPNPALPFQGVQLSRTVDGKVYVGPNSILSFKREGYRKLDHSWRDLFEILMYPGFWNLSARYYREGLREELRSWSKAAYARNLQRYIPELRKDDMVCSRAGVRAEAILRDGKFMDDFLLLEGKNSLHVCNTPSHAATASLEIAKKIVKRAPRPGRLSLVKMA